MSDTVQEEHETEGPGALHELAQDPASRKRFLKMVGGAGAASAFTVFLAACGSSNNDNSTSTAASTSAAKPAPSGGASGDLKILNYALTLEYLETQFYKDVIASNLFKGAQQSTIKSFGDQESQHVDALVATIKKLGGKPVTAPKAKFPLKDAKSVLTLAATVENLGAAAYLGQAGAIKNKEVLGAALSIHTVEARHASALNELLGKSNTPDGAFAKPADMKTVLAAVKPFLVA